MIRDEQGSVAKVVVVSRDVTERHQAEEELHRLSAHLLQVQDLERRRLARELHDTTAQHLAALTVDLANLKGLLAKSSPAAQALCCDCIQLANQAAQEIRTHSYLLHPPLLEVNGTGRSGGGLRAGLRGAQRHRGGCGGARRTLAAWRKTWNSPCSGSSRKAWRTC